MGDSIFKFKEIAKDACTHAEWWYGYGGQYAIYNDYFIRYYYGSFSFYSVNDLSHCLGYVTL